MATALDIGARLSREAAADFTGKVHFLAKINTSGKFALASAATDLIIGAIVEEAASGKMASVQFGGIIKVKLGGTVTAGDRITSDGSGNGINAAATALRQSVGIALDSGVVNEVISVLWMPSYLAAS